MSRPKPRVRPVKLVLAVLAGFATAYLGAEALAGLWNDSGWADVAAIMIAIFLIGPGLLLMFAASSPARYRAGGGVDWPGEADGTVTPARLAHRSRQGAVSVVAGMALAFPVLAPGFMEEGDPLILYLALVGLVGAESWLNLRVWREGNEAERRIIIGSATGAFFAFQLLFFLYAAAERMGLAPTITAWSTMMAIMVFYIVANTVATFRVSAASGRGDRPER